MARLEGIERDQFTGAHAFRIKPLIAPIEAKLIGRLALAWISLLRDAVAKRLQESNEAEAAEVIAQLPDVDSLTDLVTYLKAFQSLAEHDPLFTVSKDFAYSMFISVVRKSRVELDHDPAGVLPLIAVALLIAADDTEAEAERQIEDLQQLPLPAA